MTVEHTTHSNLYAVLLAGGSGTRLWPISRTQTPKHLIPLFGAETLLQQTAQRLTAVISPQHVYTVTNREHSQQAQDQLCEIDPVLIKNILSEPVAKNTLPAIAWAAFCIFQQCPEAIVSIFPSDHAIKNTPAFLTAWEQARNACANASVVLLGIKPTHPATGYGYIQTDQTEKTVIAFKEKPDVKTAEQYLQSKNYYWNSGIFVFRASHFVELLTQLVPSVALLAKKIAETGAHQADPHLYNQFDQLSIDYGLIEKMKDLQVVPVDMGWTDLGDWESLFSFQEKTNEGNVVHGDVFATNCKNSLLWSEAGTLATLGLDDIAVVQTHDATLVAKKSDLSQLKALVQTVGQRHPKIILEHRTTHKPWGYFTVLEQGPGYKTKLICVNPKSQLSLQQHQQRQEHWVVVEGQAFVTRGEKEDVLRAGETIGIPSNTKHRLSNKGTSILKIIEVQTGEYLGEDDIVRFKDDYGRCS